MLPTPSTSHVNFDHIYEPAEDSFLLLDTLSSTSESEFLHRKFQRDTTAPLVVEVGTGSGVVLAFTTAQSEHILGRSDVVTLGVDVNPFACRATVKTATQATLDAKTNHQKPAVFLDSLRGDLTTCLHSRSVDVLIFNPPYVPTEDLPRLSREDSPAPLTSSKVFERDSHLLALSYAGGQDGMETTNRLLAQVPTALSARGVAYILLCAQNRPLDVKAKVCAWQGNWSAEIVGSSGKKAGWERLSILRIWRPT